MLINLLRLKKLKQTKAAKFKVGDRVIITNYKNIFARVTSIIGQTKYLGLILYPELILGPTKLKN